jgi:hypothetical protein
MDVRIEATLVYLNIVCQPCLYERLAHFRRRLDRYTAVRAARNTREHIMLRNLSFSDLEGYKSDIDGRNFRLG